MNFKIELVTLNANAEILNSTKDTVDGAGFVRVVDSLTGIHGKPVSTSDFIADNGIETVMTIWFPVNETEGFQTGIRIFNETPDFMRQVYADFRKEACGRCGGSGVYGAHYDLNGRVAGGIGQCFRCNGHGKVTRFQNALGEMGMALWGSGIASPSYEEFCREYRQYNPRVARRVVPVVPTQHVQYCEGCGAEFPIPTGQFIYRFCADCSENLVNDFEDAAAVDLPDFVLDDGTYTLVYEDALDGSGQHFTFRVRMVKTGRLEGKRVVEYLNGPDNSLDFQAFAFVNANSLNVWKKFERGSLVNRAREIEAVARQDRAALEAAGLLYAERSSRCRRCNKVLTVPASLAAGYGPDCAAIIGIQYGATRSSDRVSPVVDSLLSADYLADLSNNELDDRIDSVTRSASRGDHYDAIANALEGERQRRIENGTYPDTARIVGDEVVTSRPMSLIEAWDLLTPKDKKIALREINAGFQEAMNETNGTRGLTY